MPAFDKNSVQVDFAYSISPQKDDEIQFQHCPRCGCQAERKHRSVCLSCKRRIPPMASRDNWESPMKKIYSAELTEELGKINSQDCKFKFKNGSKWGFIRDVRRIGVQATLVFIIVAATPHVMQMVVGEEGMEQVKQEISFLLQPPGQLAPGESAPSPKIASGLNVKASR